VVNVIQAKGLLAADSNGFSDPYVVLQLEGATVAKPLKTKVQKSTLDPVWDEEVRIPVRGRVGQLKLKVLDYDLLSGHDFLGFSKIRSAAHLCLTVSSLLPTAAWMVYMHGSCFPRSIRLFFAELE
jgi:Ca2+-dependent lipid-binding protein